MSKVWSYVVVLVLWLGVGLGCSLTAWAQGNNFAIFMDGKRVEIPPQDQQPFCLQGRVYVPLRVISEGLGARVEWKQNTRQVFIFSKGNETCPAEGTGVEVRSGNDVQVVIDGKPLVIPPEYGRVMVTKSKRTVVPLRVVGEALGCAVNWDAATRTVTLTSAPKPVDTPDGSSGSQQQMNGNQERSRLLQELAGYCTNLKLLNGSVINSQELLNKNPGDFSEEQIQSFRKMLDELKKYSKEITLPDGRTIKTWELEIMGEPIATAEQLKAWLTRETPRIKAKMEREYGRPFQPIPLELVDLYLKIGSEYGVRGDLALCQAVKETGYFQFTGLVQPWQNNYCGLWATGSTCTGQEPLNGADPQVVRFEAGVHGAIFASPEVGVEAHIQHLYAYATREAIPSGKTLCDPRFRLVSRGISPTWQGLNARWAVPGTTYGQSIIQDYWLKALTS